MIFLKKANKTIVRLSQGELNKIKEKHSFYDEAINDLKKILYHLREITSQINHISSHYNIFQNEGQIVTDLYGSFSRYVSFLSSLKHARSTKTVKTSDTYLKEKNVRNTVIEYLNGNPDSNRKQLLKYIEDTGYSKDDAEKMVYGLASEYMEFLCNGRANENSVKVEDVDSDELKMGIAVEMEHTKDKEQAKRIALDHLAELKDYYSRLKKMEEEGKKEIGITK